jgi:hypothetical protein
MDEQIHVWVHKTEGRLLIPAYASNKIPKVSSSCPATKLTTRGQIIAQIISPNRSLGHRLPLPPDKRNESHAGLFSYL